VILIGLELAPKTRAKAASQQKLTPNATPFPLLTPNPTLNRQARLSENPVKKAR
jgi:hypothetical protein